MSKSKLIKDIDIDILNNGRIKQTSFTQYKSTFNSLSRELGNYKLYDLIKIKNILEKKNITKSKQRNWLMLIYLLYKKIYGEDKKSQKVSDYLDKLINDIKNTGNKNDCTKGDIQKYKQIKLTIKQEINNPSTNIKLIDLITMYIYTNILSRRGDTRFLRIYNKKKSGGDYPYINTKTNILFFPPYKTRREVRLNISSHKAFLNKLRDAKLNNKKLYRDSLSSDKTFNKMKNSQKAYSMYIKRIFKKYFDFNVNIQKLRRLNACEDINPVFMEKIKKKAYLQSHSIGEHIRTYMRTKQ